MPVDSYALCFCGSGKKIKFCCSKDLQHDLDKIERAVEGEQFVSALDQVNKLIAAKGERAALLALQAQINLTLRNVDEAHKAASKLLEIMPHSCVALAHQAVYEVTKGEVDDAVEHLQRSLENVETVLFSPIGDAIAIVAEALLRTGRVLAARGHLLIRAGLSGGQDKYAIERITELNRIEDLPTLLRTDFDYSTPPANAAWQGEFEAAMRTARRGAWLAACESLESLDEKIPNQLAVVRNIAILRGWLGQNAEACNAWRRYIKLPGVEHDEAVDTEGLCQLLDHSELPDLMDSVILSYPIQNMDRLMELLVSDKRFHPSEPDEVEEGQPPPKASFRLLDRIPEPHRDGMTFKDFPNVLGEISIFGKQTDREARLELSAPRSSSLEESKKILAQLCGDSIGDVPQETVEGQFPKLHYFMNPALHIPEKIPVEALRQAISQQREYVYYEVWPNLTRSIFGNKSARDAAKDPAHAIAVEAAILNLELAVDEKAGDGKTDFNVLRKNLGLPERHSLQLTADQAVTSIPVSRITRLQFSQLTDEQLLDALHLSTLKGLRAATRLSAKEVIARPSVAQKVNLQELYRLLVGVEDDADEALRQIDQGKKLAATNGESPANWYLLELQVRLARHDAAGSQHLLKLLTTRHMQEPGVSESLYQILLNFGLITPDGQFRSGAESPSQPEMAASRAPESGIWTPDSAEPKQESKLWLPGM